MNGSTNSEKHFAIFVNQENERFRVFSRRLRQRYRSFVKIFAFSVSIFLLGCQQKYSSVANRYSLIPVICNILI